MSILIVFIMHWSLIVLIDTSTYLRILVVKFVTLPNGFLDVVAAVDLVAATGNYRIFCHSNCYLVGSWLGSPLPF